MEAAPRYFMAQNVKDDHGNIIGTFKLSLDEGEK